MSVSEGLGPSPAIAPDPVVPDLTGSIIKLNDQHSGGGSFGDVYRCKHRSDSSTKEVAVKAFRFNFTANEQGGNGNDGTVKMIRRELGIWRRLDHKNIVPFLGVTYGFGRIGATSLVSLWMPNGTLHDFLAKHDVRLTTARRLQLLLDIANGLHYLHSFPIIHGDLNCNNVLLDENDNARLTDFGYASLIGEIPEALAYLQWSSWRAGAVRWAAPEQIKEDIPQPMTKSDIYSFGNLAFQVFSGQLPWSEVQKDAAVVLHVAEGRKPCRPKSRPVDDRHWEFIERCWSEIQERPSANDIVSTLQHFLLTPTPISEASESLSPGLFTSTVTGKESCPSLIALGRPLDLTGSVVKLDGHPIKNGSLANVYRCKHDSNSGTKEVAVKVFLFKITVDKREGTGSEKCAKMVGMWKGLDHKNIVPFLGIVYGFDRRDRAALVSSWMPNRTLQDFLVEHDGQLTDSRRLQLLLDIAHGLLYLHSFPLIHGYLTCNNVLLDANNNACLTDFGYAEIPEVLSYLRGSTMRVGTLRWPEQIKEDTPQRTTKSDIYTFGNLALEASALATHPSSTLNLLQVFSGKQPCSEIQQDAVVVLLLSQSKKPSRPKSRSMDDQYWEFIERCWSKVQERPSAKEIVSTLEHFLASSLPPSQSAPGINTAN
ncbi:kinase-like protein [Paxillus ammoniavirescens]|nr:kinase-like protein [Paxillus ammoniavirescens]